MLCSSILSHRARLPSILGARPLPRSKCLSDHLEPGTVVGDWSFWDLDHLHRPPLGDPVPQDCKNSRLSLDRPYWDCLRQRRRSRCPRHCTSDWQNYLFLRVRFYRFPSCLGYLVDWYFDVSWLWFFLNFAAPFHWPLRYLFTVLSLKYSSPLFPVRFVTNCTLKYN